MEYWITYTRMPLCHEHVPMCQCPCLPVFLLPLIQEMTLQQLLVSCESDDVTKSLAHDHSCHL